MSTSIRTLGSRLFALRSTIYTGLCVFKYTLEAASSRSLFTAPPRYAGRHV